MTSLQTVLRLQGYRKTALVSYPHTPAGCCRSRSQNDSSRCRWRRDSNIVRSYKFQNQTSRTHLHLRREEKKTHTFEKKKTNSTWSQALHLYITLWSQFVWRSSDYELQYLYFIHLLPLNPFQGCCGSWSWSQQSPSTLWTVQECVWRQKTIHTTVLFTVANLPNSVCFCTVGE